MLGNRRIMAKLKRLLRLSLEASSTKPKAGWSLLPPPVPVELLEVVPVVPVPVPALATPMLVASTGSPMNQKAPSPTGHRGALVRGRVGQVAGVGRR